VLSLPSRTRLAPTSPPPTSAHQGMLSVSLVAIASVPPTAVRLRCVAPRSRVVLSASSGDDPLRLSDITDELSSKLLANGDSTPSPLAELITRQTADDVVPLVRNIYSPALDATDRRSSIEALSRSLDALEETVRGPMLVGSSASAADAALYPSIIACELTLPVHFGWTEWTDEALFYRRPRLHAWRELMAYERAARTVEDQIAARLAELDLSAFAFEVPTSKIRTFPLHAL